MLRPNELLIRNVRGAGVGPSIGTVIMPYTRLKGYHAKTKRGRSKLTLFLCAPRKLLGFSAWMEIYLVLVWRSKLTWLLCAGRK